MSDPNLSSFIWSVADLLRGDYKQSEYGKVILPFTVLRRLDCVLEPTKAAVLAEKAKREAGGVNVEPFLLRKSGQLFYNTSPLDLRKLVGDQDNIAENLRKYIQAFSPAVRDIFESFEFHTQIFDYGNTAIEKRAIFYKRLLPLIEFDREREGIDLSKVRLTHHTLKNLGKVTMHLSDGATPKLEPVTEAGSGSVQEKQRARLDEIIEKVNTLFEGDLTDQDKLVYVNDVIKGKLLESTTLVQQAANNTKEQFANSPDLKTELMNAIMGALDAHTAMSTQALNSNDVREGMKEILLEHAGLWESLRKRAAG